MELSRSIRSVLCCCPSHNGGGNFLELFLHEVAHLDVAVVVGTRAFFKAVEVEAELSGWLVVVVVDGEVDGVLERFYLSAVHVVAQVVAERPHEGYVGVGGLESVELFTAYPSVLVAVLALQYVGEEGWAHPVEVVDVDVWVLALQDGAVCYGAASAEEVYEVAGLWQQLDDALCESVLAAHVW